MEDSANASGGLRPVKEFLPTWTGRRIADACREGRIPGAVKVGRMWAMRRSDFERWIGAAAKHLPPRPPSVDDAAVDLRRRGVI
jgi:hypothetical protein